jgi:hypothetical protein
MSHLFCGMFTCLLPVARARNLLDRVTNMREGLLLGIRLGNYTFDGPYGSIDYLEDRSGVYAILCLVEDTYSVVDIGESAQVKTRVETHDRKHCWSNNCVNGVKIAVYYTPHLHQPGRMAIEQELRDQYNPPCGDR